MKVRINGRVYDCVTVSSLAAMCNFTPSTIRKMEQRGVLPKANIHVDSDTPIPGKKRLYTKELAEKVAKIFAEEDLKPPQKRDPKTLIALKRAFQEELTLINSK